MSTRAIYLDLAHVALFCGAALTLIGAERSVPAFPGAEGAGAFAVGGRGGTVYHVTTLSATGPGSLSDAVSQPNRMVVFDVSGIIDITGLPARQLVIAKSNITVAGQSAPGEGICLRGGSLEITGSDVIVRHLRVRRGYIKEGDRGDAINAEDPTGGTMQYVLLDHVSASWATDETITSYGHLNHVTIQYAIISEGLDYDNPRQTPRKHGFGSIWGCGWNDGRVSMHHTLYAHQGMRAPRVVGGGTPPAVMDFRNNVVYDSARYNGHTGRDPVLLNWVNNFYAEGPSTRPELRGVMFTFMQNPGSRMYCDGNVIAGHPEATRDNWLAVRFERHIESSPAMHVGTPYAVPFVTTQTAEVARDRVLAGAGATLPARDSVDFRVTNDVRNGTGRVIGRETDLPPDERWPDYHALPAPPDADGDGLPDTWERQRGLDPANARDGAAIAGDYSNLEHYLNNTLRPGESRPVVYVAATVSRAKPGQPGAICVARTGDHGSALAVRLSVGGSATPGRDVPRMREVVVIPVGAESATLQFPVLPSARSDRVASITVLPSDDYFTGCPGAALVVTQIAPAEAPSTPD